MTCSPVHNLPQMERQLKLKFLRKKKFFFKSLVDHNYLVMDVRSLDKSCKDDVEDLDTKKRIMSMLIMCNYYYILSSAQIYFKHFKRLKYYKKMKKYTNKQEKSSGKMHFRSLSRIANRATYCDLLQEAKKQKKKKNIAHFKDTERAKEAHADRTSADDPIHHHMLDAFEAHYRAIIGTLTMENVHSLANELQDFYFIPKARLISLHYTLIVKNMYDDLDLFFK
ncbi:unnamed protein product [Plasmodium vivax]|nr:unnamed protein product [Plasmodium vivax]VUZ94349.1 conserved Plasmodium protein, unknown function [Plasmodium vivax]